MAKPRRKRRRRRSAGPAKGPLSATSRAAGREPASRGGVLQGMRSSFRQLAGADAEAGQRSRLSLFITLLLLIATAGLLYYRFVIEPGSE